MSEAEEPDRGSPEKSTQSTSAEPSPLADQYSHAEPTAVQRAAHALRLPSPAASSPPAPHRPVPV